MRALVALAALAAPLVYAQPNVEAGKAKVATVCAACHGLNGVSVSDTIPNLAAQRAAYLEAQLKAFKDGLRRPAGPVSPTATMAAIAAQLSAEDIVNVAAYFAAQPGASQVAQKSPLLPNLAKTHVTFPEDYKTSFVKYHTINFPATRQVRYYYANKAAVDAAKANKPLPVGSYLFAEVHAAKQPVIGKDGFFEAEKPLFFTAMQSGPGWGQDIPDMLRNGDWNYGIF